MMPHIVGTLVDCGIPIAGGIWATPAAAHKIGPVPGASEKYDAWHERWGPWLRILGPVLVAISVLRLVVALVTGQG